MRASSTPAPDPHPAGPALPDPHATAHALVERQMQVLTRLTEIGMDIAEAAREWALARAEAAASHAPPEARAAIAAPAAPAAPAGPADPGLVFSRVARAVRLTLMLQTRLLKELPALGRAEALARSAQEEARRERAHRLAVRAIKAEHEGDPETVEQLSDEAWERLRDEDLSDGLSGRPMGEVVSRICADLGLSPDWTAQFMAPAMAAVTPTTASTGLRRPSGGSRAHPGPDLEMGWGTDWATGPAPPGPRRPAGAHGAPPG